MWAMRCALPVVLVSAIAFPVRAQNGAGQAAACLQRDTMLALDRSLGLAQGAGTELR